MESLNWKSQISQEFASTSPKRHMRLNPTASFNCGDPGLRPIGSSHLALREHLIPAVSPNTGMLRCISLEEISRPGSGQSISVDVLGKAV